ncbi:Conserved_hypothetical protein [Hexamita inflata]|uniref:Uncharacterized protein n=1 Tax=Hexamita inflata TaxID=28002 RepID=A0AA86RL23_9EUKA|nr:Conserved hypothetical protein [Hexamita inflata]
MFCSILHFKQLSLTNLYTNCHNNILLDSNQYNFCEKSKSLNQVQLVNDINLIHKYNTQLFIYTDTVQQSAFDLQILNYDVKVFVLFGLGANQSVSDSRVNVSLHFEVFQGALLCVQCNITVLRCTLVFTASGRQLSGLLIEANKLVDISQSFIQFRFSGLNVSGIVNHVNSADANISICDCNLTGHNLISGGYSGYLSSLMSSVITVHISEMNVCVDNMPQLGNQSISVTFNGSAVLRCDLCGLSKLIYGLCADALPHSQELNGMWQCVLPFIYTNDQCVCAQGYAFEDDVCVNITQSIRSSSQQIGQLRQNITDAQTELARLDKSLEQNTSALKELVLASQSALEDYIKLNYSQLLLGWQTDVSALDGRIFNNATVLANDLKTSVSALDKYLSQNSTELDWRIFNNVSALNASILDIQNDIMKLTSDSAAFREEVKDNLTLIDSFVKQNVSSTLYEINQKIGNQTTITKEIVQNISQLSNQLVNADQSIFQNTSQLQNQITILENLVMKPSTGVDAYVLDSRILGNVSILESRIIGNASLLEQYFESNATALDMRIYNNVSVINLDILNVNNIIQGLSRSVSSLNHTMRDDFTILRSNITSISEFTQIIDESVQIIITNVSTLNSRIHILENMIVTNSTALESYIYQNASTIDLRIFNNVTNLYELFTTLQKTFNDFIAQINCTNYINHQYVNNKCVVQSCQITGQMRVNSVCRCANVNEIVVNGSCQCPKNSFLKGSACVCSENAVLEEECKCVISGQTMNEGKCTCVVGQSLVDGRCQEIITVGTCSQSAHFQTFDINELTYSVGTNNLSAGYVFGTKIVENAFIDVKDNIYPLFKSQNTFTNLKIQFQTHRVSEGSLIVSSISSANVKHMNIISKPGSELTVNTASQLNIFTYSLSGSNITNLLVNLSFAPSIGNITLINNINGVLNITGYQVLGKYVSTQTVAMIGNNVNANVKVNQVSFKPSVYNVGNCSSYLFSTSSSIITISYLSVIIGDSSNYLLLGSIDIKYMQYYLFGGVIAYISGDSRVFVNNLISDSYQKFSSSLVNMTGFLVGFAQSDRPIISINSICLQQSVSGTSSFYAVGLIGRNEVELTLQNCFITLIADGELNQFGIVGLQTKNPNVVISNLNTSMSVSSGSNIGSVFGQSFIINCRITNTSIFRGNLNAQVVGGFIGYYGLSNATIINSMVQNTNISGEEYAGGFIGRIQDCYIYITNSTIQFTRIMSQGKSGLICVLEQMQHLSVIISSSSSFQNYINGVLEQDCAVLNHRC